MFKKIHHIDDVRPFVAGKKEIRFNVQPNGVTVGCYMFMDSGTFDSPEAIECRGIAFDRSGEIISRPLHKFFNVGEKEWLSPQRLKERNDITAVYEKLDGSMIATAWVDGSLQWRSKKLFDSRVVKLTQRHVQRPENRHLQEFSHEVAASGLTAVFELTHPEARIVVPQEAPALRLLHVRDNITGAYVMLDPSHEVHEMISRHQVPVVQRFEGMALEQALESLEDMEKREGYVLQFENGEMTKLKCPWYLRLHRSISLLRERDIAMLALNEELDDTKGYLVEAGIDLSEVNEVEARLHGILTGIIEEVDEIYRNGQHLDRKEFALANKGHPLFGLAMQRYTGNEIPLLDWYQRNRLKDDFSLRKLSGAATEDLEEEFVTGPGM